MGVISWIVLGLLAGALARAIMPGPDKKGCMMTMVLGLVGAVVGGWIGSQFGWGKVDVFDLRSLALSVVGALLLLGLGRLFFRRPS